MHDISGDNVARVLKRQANKQVALADSSYTTLLLLKRVIT